MKLSIIVPTFNCSDSIHSCLASIKCQTFLDYEVLIQDGLSQDATLEMVSHFQDANPSMKILVHQEPDEGVYDAMNKAVARAQGEWLYFLGSDDELFDENVFERMMGCQESRDYEVLYGSVKVIGDAGWAKDSIYDGEFSLNRLLKSNICHQAIFYRGSLFRRCQGYNVNYKVCSDWDLNLKCWSKARFKYIDIVVANFYAGGISSNSPRDERFSAEVTQNVLRYFGLSIDDPLLNTPEFVGHLDIAKMQRERERSNHMVRYYLRAMARKAGIIR